MKNQQLTLISHSSLNENYFYLFSKHATLAMSSNASFYLLNMPHLQRNYPPRPYSCQVNCHPFHFIREIS